MSKSIVVGLALSTVVVLGLGIGNDSPIKKLGDDAPLVAFADGGSKPLAFGDGKAPLDDGKAPLDDGKAPLDDGKAPLDDGKAPLKVAGGSKPMPPIDDGYELT